MAAFESKYSWKSGYKPKVSADIVGNALDRMRRESDDGTVNAEMLLEYSRPTDSETHDLFEWNDGIAAEKWRMYQSGRIINQLEVTMVRISKDPVEMPMPTIEGFDKPIVSQAFINIAQRGPANRGSYTDAMTAFQNESYRNRVLSNAKSELEAFKRKYERFEELADVFAAINRFEASM